MTTLAPLALRAFSACFALAFLLLSAGAGLAADAANGEKIYKRKCRTCHSLEPGQNKVGPSLHGIMGRTAGTEEGYKYSTAMKDSGVVWDEASLDEYLAKPKEFIPKSKMVFAGFKKESDRQDVIAYLKEAAQ